MARKPALAIPTLSLTPAFWQRVARTNDDTSCWLWTGSYDPSTGYGRLKYQGLNYIAHRIAWTIEEGPIPNGLFVCHSCDIRGCVRHDGERSHLFLATNAENTADRHAKGRDAKGLRHGTRTHPGLHKGERNAFAKLTDEQVATLRILYRTGQYSQTELANLARIAQAHVSRIVLYHARNPD